MRVTIRTPAGRSRSFAVDRHETAGELTSRAVAGFVADAALDQGRFRLGLLRGRRIVDLATDVPLSAEGVRGGDVLHLLDTDPQVDG